MVEIDRILSNIANMTHDLTSSIQRKYPLNLVSDMISSVEKINIDLKNHRQFLTLGHLNTVSIPLHKDKIFRVLKKIDLDIFGVSETNIKQGTPKDLFNFPGYKLFHLNRDYAKCGGVGIFLKDEYASKAKLINVNFNQSQPEHIFVEFEIRKVKILVGVLYKSPKIRYGVFGDIFETLAFLTTKYDNCVFLGDFNINQLTPNEPDYKFLKNNIIEPLSLEQIIKEPTRITKNTCTLIDLILVNSPDKVKTAGCADLPGLSDHHIVYCSYSLKKIKFPPQFVKRRDFRNFDKDKFNDEINNAQWNTVEGLVNQNIDEATMHFEKIYTDAINKFAPYREIRVTKPVTASWLNDEIISLMDLRDKFKLKHNQIVKINKRINLLENPSDTIYYTKFKELKNQVNHLIRNAKIADFNNKINQKIKDSKKFHFNLKEFNIVDSKKNFSKCHIDPNKLNDCFSKNNNAKVSEFIIKKMVKKLNKNSRRANFKFSEVTPNEIIKTTKTLKSNACGIDEISAFFIKISISSSAHIFSKIVNASLRSGVFPSLWKKARIKPIPKISEPIKATDYRPISLLIAFSKILEKIVAKQMKQYLVDNNLLDKFQSAYQEKHSTTTALIDITDNIYKALDNSEITILVLLDYSKAFDCANHKLILAKLKALGFMSSALDWIDSYLSKRSQQVVTDKGESSWIELLNGVPQGSILGPLLFTILVSDISNDIKHCKYHLYADDTQLYISGKVCDIQNLIKKMNSDLKMISEFSVNNFLKLNEGKSQYIIIGSRQNIKTLNNMQLSPITLNGEVIERETTVKNLGILFDENLSWDAEINKCISKGYSKLRQAYRYKHFLSKNSKKLIVLTYVLSQFNYSSIILQNLTKIQCDKIQKFQNNCARFILNLRKFDHISEGLKEIRFLKMSKNRDLQSLVLMYKICHNLAPSYLCERISYRVNHHRHNTRSKFNIHIKHSRTNFGKYSFFNNISNKYNILTQELDLNNNISLNSFKSKLKTHFLQLS